MSNHTKIWCIFNVDEVFKDYDFSINKRTIQDIKDWKEVKTDIYYRNFNSEDGIQDGTRKTLILWLMTENDDNGSQDTKIEGNNKESEKVKIYFSRTLLDTLLDTNDSPIIEPDYTTTKWWKIHFYVNDSLGKDSLIETLKQYSSWFYFK